MRRNRQAADHFKYFEWYDHYSLEDHPDTGHEQKQPNFFYNGKNLAVAKVLRWFEEQQSLVRFVRTHRMQLLNLQYIKSYNGDKEGLKWLHTGKTFSVSKRKKSSLSGSLHQREQLSSGTTADITFNIKKTIAA